MEDIFINDENNELKVGDKYDLMTFNYYDYMFDCEDKKPFKGKKYYDTVIKYITPTGGYILDILDKEALLDDGMFASLHKGEEIKEYYMDFEGDDDVLYCVVYDEKSPFYEK